MKTQVRKWGNSLAVRIPKAFAEDLRLTQDSPVELSIVDGCLMIRPALASTYTLNDLLTQVSDSNIHTEHDFGPEVGKEA
jgi:antitoxin MazE